MKLKNRKDAGQRLAHEMRSLGRLADPIVLAIPPGGVPVGFEIAVNLSAPLDIFVAREVAVPGQRALNLGAVAQGGYVEVNRESIHPIPISEQDLSATMETAQRDVEDHARRLRGHRAPPNLEGRSIILADDGIAHPGMVRAAIRALRSQRPRHVFIAVPVAPQSVVPALNEEVDRVVCLLSPLSMQSVSFWYEDFARVTDEEATRLLERANVVPTTQ